MADGMEIRDPGVWRCPKCGAELVAERDHWASPPVCRFGHAPSEMEQAHRDSFGSGRGSDV